MTYLSKVPAAEIFPGANDYGAVDTARKVAPVMAASKIVGYVFLNTDFSDAIGYSGKPIVILIAVDLAGEVKGAKLVHHTEPIVLAGIPEEKITSFISSYKSLNIPKLAVNKPKSSLPADIISGATVTILVIDDSMRRAAIKAARLLGLGNLKVVRGRQARLERSLDRSSEVVRDWQSMLGEGFVRRLNLSVSDVNEAFAKTGNQLAIERAEKGSKKDTFIDLYAASLGVPGVAKSLLGEAEYNNLKKRLNPGQEAFLIMGNGRYSFKGSGYVRGGIFDRISVVQGENTLRFRDKYHKRLSQVAAEGAPRFKELALFITPKEVRFNAAEPWRLQLLVHRAIGAIKKVFVNFELAYQVPPAYVIETQSVGVDRVTNDVAALVDDETARTQLWQRVWEQKYIKVAILSTAIFLLTVLFFFQDSLVKSAVWLDRVRLGFLVFTLFWIGFYAQAQLSVVNVFVFANSLIKKFRWEFFLMEPLIFILWCSVVASLLFWGRGAYCGWLCPFGALQELLSRGAKYFKVPQINVPWGLHERLWPLKYLIFLVLLGVSFYSMALAETLAEVEPFKTSIILYFNRSWPYVLFAVVVLGIGLTIERFYCRYICPLGAALAIPGRVSMFHWLKRYRNCGDPCHLCAKECMVQAIDPLGEINPNECLHCMNCQQMYYNENICPVVINKLAKAGKVSKETLLAPVVEEAKAMTRKPRRLGRARTIGD